MSSRERAGPSFLVPGAGTKPPAATEPSEGLLGNGGGHLQESGSRATEASARAHQAELPSVASALHSQADRQCSTLGC